MTRTKLTTVFGKQLFRLPVPRLHPSRRSGNVRARRFGFVAALALACLSAEAGAQTPVTEANILFLYEARAEIPAPHHKLAELISHEYRNARDEFTRHDLFQKIKPVIDRRLEEARSTSRVVVRVGAELADYQFEKGAFPSGFTESTYLRLRYPYQVRFANAPDFALLRVPVDDARELSGQLRESRRCTFAIEGTIARVAEIDWRNKAVFVEAERVELHLQSGAKVTTLDINRRQSDD